MFAVPPSLTLRVANYQDRFRGINHIAMYTHYSCDRRSTTSSCILFTWRHHPCSSIQHQGSGDSQVSSGRISPHCVEKKRLIASSYTPLSFFFFFLFEQNRKQTHTLSRTSRDIELVHAHLVDLLLGETPVPSDTTRRRTPSYGNLPPHHISHFTHLNPQPWPPRLSAPETKVDETRAEHQTGPGLAGREYERRSYGFRFGRDKR